MIEDDSTRCSVLLIDDESFAQDIIAHGLKGCAGHQLMYESNSARAVEVAREVDATVVLVDLRMPGGVDGFDVITALCNHPATHDIPVILLSSEDDPDIKAKAFALGASDYMVKWPDARELVARVRHHSGACIARRERDQAFASLRRSQEELAASQSALQQSQKMEAIGQLTGGVAHDFNNVLQIIGGNLQLVKLTGDLSDAAKARIDLALAGVERGAKLASHLLAFARRQPLQSIVIDPAPMLRELDDMARRLLDVQTRVHTDIAADLGSAVIDPNQLNNVLLNLIINARDAMPDGGILTLRAANVGPDDERPAELSSDDFVLIEIADNGKGMPPDVLARAFEPFFTTKPTGQGTGLGLSMAYGFVKQSGGEIVLRSEAGSGTSVRIYLPRSRAAPASATEHPYHLPLAGGLETILVVEDEEDVRSSTSGILSALGYEVLEAADASQAVAIIEEGRHIDLVFTDVVMPGPMSSLQLGEIVRRKLPECEVLYTSGYAEGVLTHEGKLDSAVHLLQKPYHPEALSARIRHLLRRAKRAAGKPSRSAHFGLM